MASFGFFAKIKSISSVRVRINVFPSSFGELAISKEKKFGTDSRY